MICFLFFDRNVLLLCWCVGTGRSPLQISQSHSIVLQSYVDLTASQQGHSDQMKDQCQVLLEEGSTSEGESLTGLFQRDLYTQHVHEESLLYLWT